ncbi:MAG: hypothetical protein JNL98_25305 [Bryobacterales bacterium]|nr:hypothetical protein [Bryobacterales bacterium]
MILLWIGWKCGVAPRESNRRALVLDRIGKQWCADAGSLPLDRRWCRRYQNSAHHRPPGDSHGNSLLHGKPVINQPMGEEMAQEMPAEIDFSKATRGRHHIPAEAAVFLPASIERSVWEYFSDKAERKGIGLSQLLTDVLKRDIEINEALK